MKSTRRTDGLRFAAGAGAVGALAAALCCAGTPVVLSALGAVGLTFLRRDAILWPVMLVALVIAVWGLQRGCGAHRRTGPLLLGSIGAVSLAVGVMVVHGFPAMQMIYGGGGALLLATIWNVWARRACGRIPPRPEQPA